MRELSNSELEKVAGANPLLCTFIGGATGAVLGGFFRGPSGMLRGCLKWGFAGLLLGCLFQLDRPHSNYNPNCGDDWDYDLWEYGGDYYDYDDNDYDMDILDILF